LQIADVHGSQQDAIGDRNRAFVPDPEEIADRRRQGDHLHCVFIVKPDFCTGPLFVRLHRGNGRNEVNHWPAQVDQQSNRAREVRDG
jgi:hypothetical protein